MFSSIVLQVWFHVQLLFYFLSLHMQPDLQQYIINVFFYFIAAFILFHCMIKPHRCHPLQRNLELNCRSFSFRKFMEQQCYQFVCEI